MKSLISFLTGASVVGAGVYLLASYIVNAPTVSLRLVIISGTALLVAGSLFVLWYWPARGTD